MVSFWGTSELMEVLYKSGEGRERGKGEGEGREGRERGKGEGEGEREGREGRESEKERGKGEGKWREREGREREGRRTGRETEEDGREKNDEVFYSHTATCTSSYRPVQQQNNHSNRAIPEAIVSLVLSGTSHGEGGGAMMVHAHTGLSMV